MFSFSQTIPFLRSSLLWDVTQRRLVVTDVSVQPTDPIFKGQAVQEECWEHLKMG